MVKRSSIIILTCCFAALLLGLILAYPLLATNLPAVKKEELIVDVVYTYLGAPYSDQNISGLWRNYSIPQEIVDNGGLPFDLDINVVPYFIVVNITNTSNQPVYLTNFEIAVGPSISVGPNEIVSVAYGIITEIKQVDYIPGWDNYLSANSSRLIYFSGLEGVRDVAYKSILENDSVEISARVEGRLIGEENVIDYGKDIKKIELQSFGQDFLYNKLVNQNQTLIFYDELDVSVGTRLPQ